MECSKCGYIYNGVENISNCPKCGQNFGLKEEEGLSKKSKAAVAVGAAAGAIAGIANLAAKEGKIFASSKDDKKAQGNHEQQEDVFSETTGSSENTQASENTIGTTEGTSQSSGSVNASTNADDSINFGDESTGQVPTPGNVSESSENDSSNETPSSDDNTSNSVTENTQSNDENDDSNSSNEDTPSNDESNTDDSVNEDIPSSDESNTDDSVNEDTPSSDESNTDDSVNEDTPSSDESNADDSVNEDTPSSDESNTDDSVNEDTPGSDENSQESGSGSSETATPATPASTERSTGSSGGNSSGGGIPDIDTSLADVETVLAMLGSSKSLMSVSSGKGFGDVFQANGSEYSDIGGVLDAIVDKSAALSEYVSTFPAASAQKVKSVVGGGSAAGYASELAGKVENLKRLLSNLYSDYDLAYNLEMQGKLYEADPTTGELKPTKALLDLQNLGINTNNLDEDVYAFTTNYFENEMKNLNEKNYKNSFLYKGLENTDGINLETMRKMYADFNDQLSVSIAALGMSGILDLDTSYGDADGTLSSYMLSNASSGYDSLDKTDTQRQLEVYTMNILSGKNYGDLNSDEQKFINDMYEHSNNVNNMYNEASNNISQNRGGPHITYSGAEGGLVITDKLATEREHALQVVGIAANNMCYTTTVIDANGNEVLLENRVFMSGYDREYGENTVPARNAVADNFCNLYIDMLGANEEPKDENQEKIYAAGGVAGLSFWYNYTNYDVKLPEWEANEIAYDANIADISAFVAKNNIVDMASIRDLDETVYQRIVSEGKLCDADGNILEGIEINDLAATYLAYKAEENLIEWNAFNEEMGVFNGFANAMQRDADRADAEKYYFGYLDGDYTGNDFKLTSSLNLANVLTEVEMTMLNDNIVQNENFLNGMKSQYMGDYQQYIETQLNEAKKIESEEAGKATGYAWDLFALSQQGYGFSLASATAYIEKQNEIAEAQAASTEKSAYYGTRAEALSGIHTANSVVITELQREAFNIKPQLSYYNEYCGKMFDTSSLKRDEVENVVRENTNRENYATDEDYERAVSNSVDLQLALNVAEKIAAGEDVDYSTLPESVQTLLNTSGEQLISMAIVNMQIENPNAEIDLKRFSDAIQNNVELLQYYGQNSGENGLANAVGSMMFDLNTSIGNENFAENAFKTLNYSFEIATSAGLNLEAQRRANEYLASKSDAYLEKYTEMFNNGEISAMEMSQVYENYAMYSVAEKILEDFIIPFGNGLEGFGHGLENAVSNTIEYLALDLGLKDIYSQIDYDELMATNPELAASMAFPQFLANYDKKPGHFTSVDDVMWSHIMEGAKNGETSWGKIDYYVMQATQSIGNMAIPMAVSAIPGCQGLGSALLFTSAYGNSFEACRVEGMNPTAGLVYSLCSAGTEMVMEKFLGGMPYLSKASSAIGLNGYVRSMLSEAREEMLQEFIDPFLKDFAFFLSPQRDKDGNIVDGGFRTLLSDPEAYFGNYLVNDFDLEAMVTSGIVAMISAGITNGGKLGTAIQSKIEYGNWNLLEFEQTIRRQQLMQQGLSKTEASTIIGQELALLSGTNVDFNALIKTELNTPGIEAEFETWKESLSENDPRSEFNISDYVMQKVLTENVTGSITTLEGTIGKIDAQISQINQQISEKNLTMTEQAAINEQLSELKSRRESLIKEITTTRDTLNSQIESSVQKISELNANLESINEQLKTETDKTKIKEFESQQKNLIKEISSLMSDIRMLNYRLGEVTAPDVQNRIKVLEGMLEEVKKQPQSPQRDLQIETLQNQIGRSQKNLVNILQNTNNSLITQLNDMNKTTIPDGTNTQRNHQLQEGIVRQITENQRKINELEKQGIHPNGSPVKMSPATKEVVNNVNTMNSILDEGNKLLKKHETSDTSTNPVSTATVGTSTNQVAANVDTMNNIVGTGNAIVGIASGGATVGTLIGGIKSGILDLETKIKNFDKNGNNLNENPDGTRDTRTRRELKKELHEKRQMLGKIENSLHEYSMTENSPLKEFLDQMNSEIRDMELGKFDSEKVAEAYEVNITTMSDKTAAQLKAQVTEFIKAINSINYSNMTFDQKLSEKFTDIQTLFDTLMNKIDFTESLSAVESIVKTLDMDASSQTTINTKLSELTDALTGLETNIREYNSTFDSSKLTEIKKAFNTISTQIEGLSTELSNSLSVLTNNYSSLAVNIETSGVSAMTIENIKSISDLLGVVYKSINGTYSYFDSLTKLTQISDMSKNHLKNMNVFKVSNEFNEMVNKFKNGDIDFDEFKVKLNSFGSGFNTVMNTYYSIDSTAFETVEPNTITKNQTSIQDVFSSITTSNLSEAFELLKNQIGTIFVDSDAKKFEFITGLNELEKDFKHLLENTSTESVNTSNVTDLKAKLDGIVSSLTKHINNNATSIKVTEVNGTLVAEQVSEAINNIKEENVQVQAEDASHVEEFNAETTDNNVAQSDSISENANSLDVPNFENVDSSIEEMSIPEIEVSQNVESLENVVQSEVVAEEVKVENESVIAEQNVVTVEQLKNEVLDLMLNAEDTDVALETFAKKITDMLETNRSTVKEFFNTEGIRAIKLNVLAKCDQKTVETICEQLMTYKSVQEVFTIALNADYVNSITKTEGFNQIIWSTGVKVINRVKLLYIARPAVMNILKSITQNNTEFTDATNINDYLSLITNRIGNAKLRLYQTHDVDLNRVVDITSKLNARVYLTHSINKTALDLVVNQFITNINSPQIPTMLKNCLDSIEFHDARNPLDYYWATQYGSKSIIVPFLSAATGGFGSFTAWNLSPATLSTISHELGHSFDTKYAEMMGYGSSFFSKNNPAWQQAVDADGKKISSYGKNSLSEDFAETMSMFVTNRAKLQKQFPNRYNQLVSMMREYAAYTLEINNVTDTATLRELMIENGIDSQMADNILNSGHSLENIKSAVVDYVAFTDDIQTKLDMMQETQDLTVESVKTMSVEDIVNLANTDLDSIPTLMKSGNYEFLQNANLSNEAFEQAIEYMKSENRLFEITNVSIDVGTNVQKAFVGFMNNLHIKTDSSIDLELQAKLLSDVMLNPNSQIADIKMVSGFLTTMGYIKSPITVSDLSVAKNLLDAGYANIVPTSNIYSKYSQLLQQKIATTNVYENRQIINQLVANKSPLIGELINSKNISVVQGLLRNISQLNIDGFDFVFSQLDAKSVPNLTKLLFDGISKYSDGTPYLSISDQRMQDIVGITNTNVRDYIIKKTFEALYANVGYDFNNSRIVKEIAKLFGNGYTTKDTYWGLAEAWKQAKSNLYRNAIGLNPGDVINNAGVNVRVYEYGTNPIMKKHLSEFNKSFNQLPPVYKNCAQYMGLHGELCELNVVEIIKNDGKPRNGEFYGYNYNGTRQIELFNGHVGLWNIAHEIGHIFDSEYSNLLDGIRSNTITNNPFSESGFWSNAIEQDAALSQNRYNPFGKYVSQYGKDSVEVTHVGFKEDFCDSMAKFFTDRNRFLEQFPNRAKAIISMMYDFTSMKYENYLTTEQGLKDLLQLFNEDPSQVDALLKSYSFEATRDAVIEHVTFGSELNPNLDTMRDLITQLGTPDAIRAIYNFNATETEITAPMDEIVSAVNGETSVNAGYSSNMPTQVSNLNDVVAVITAMGRNPQNIIDAYIQTGNINLFTRTSGVRDFISQYTIEELKSMINQPSQANSAAQVSNKAEKLTQFDYVEFEFRKGNYQVINDPKLSYETLRDSIIYLQRNGKLDVLNNIGLNVTDKRIVNGLINMGVYNFTVSPELYRFTVAKLINTYTSSDLSTIISALVKTNNPLINAFFDTNICRAETMLSILNNTSESTFEHIKDKYFTFDYKLKLFEALNSNTLRQLFNVNQNMDATAYKKANIFANKLMSSITNEIISKIKVREYIPFLPNSIVNKIRMNSSSYANMTDNEVIKVITDAKSEAEYELIKLGIGMSTRPIDYDGVEVRFFANNQTAHQNLLRKFESFKKIYNKLPSTFRDCLTQMNFLDMSDPDNDSYSIDTYGNINFRFTAAGAGGNGIFYLWNNAISTNLMAHEIAHSLDTEYARYKLGKNGYYTELNNDWKNAIELDNRRVTKYGDTSIAEDFAESVAIYMEHRESFINKYPNRAAVIEAMLKDLTVMKNGLENITTMKDMANKLIECKVPKAQILDFMKQGYNVQQLKNALIEHLALGTDMYDALATSSANSTTYANYRTTVDNRAVNINNRKGIKSWFNNKFFNQNVQTTSQMVNQINQMIATQGIANITIKNAADISVSELRQISDLNKVNFFVSGIFSDINGNIKQKYNNPRYIARHTYTGVEMLSINAKLDQLQSRIDMSLPVRERARQIYELIASEYSYMRGYNESEDTYLVSQSLRGITSNNIVGRQGLICAGYASVFKELCSRCGITCDYIRGDVITDRLTNSGGRHAWNVVIDTNGEVIPVDCCWRSGGGKDYFGKSDMFAKDRYADADETYKDYAKPYDEYQAYNMIDFTVRTMDMKYGPGSGIKALREYLKTGNINLMTSTNGARETLSRMAYEDISDYIKANAHQDLSVYENQIRSIYESMAIRHNSYGQATDQLVEYIKTGNIYLITSYNGARESISNIPVEVLKQFVNLRLSGVEPIIAASPRVDDVRNIHAYKSQKTSIFNGIQTALQDSLGKFRETLGNINVNSAESSGLVTIERNPGKVPYGQSEKNLINSSDGDVIFKQTTENESFAEVIGYEIAKSIDLSSARYDFATMDGKNGVVSYSIEQDGFEFKRANQLLSEANQSYGAIVHKYESIANEDVENANLDVKKQTIKELIELSKHLKLQESTLFETIDVETITEYNFGTIYTDLTSAINNKINEYSKALNNFNTNQINVTDVTTLVEILTNTTDMNIDKESAVLELTKMFIYDSVLYPGFRPLGDWGMMYNKTTGELTFAPIYDNSSICGLDGTVSTITEERLSMLKDLIDKSDSKTISMIKDTLSKFNTEEINKIFEQIESQYGKQIPSEIRTTVVQSIETNMERINQLFEENSSNGNSSPDSSPNPTTRVFEITNLKTQLEEALRIGLETGKVILKIGDKKILLNGTKEGKSYRGFFKHVAEVGIDKILTFDVAQRIYGDKTISDVIQKLGVTDPSIIEEIRWVIREIDYEYYNNQKTNNILSSKIEKTISDIISRSMLDDKTAKSLAKELKNILKTYQATSHIMSKDTTIKLMRNSSINTDPKYSEFYDYLTKLETPSFTIEDIEINGVKYTIEDVRSIVQEAKFKLHTAALQKFFEGQYFQKESIKDENGNVVIPLDKKTLVNALDTDEQQYIYEALVRTANDTDGNVDLVLFHFQPTNIIKPADRMKKMLNRIVKEIGNIDFAKMSEQEVVSLIENFDSYDTEEQNAIYKEIKYRVIGHKILEIAMKAEEINLKVNLKQIITDILDGKASSKTGQYKTNNISHYEEYMELVEQVEQIFEEHGYQIDMRKKVKNKIDLKVAEIEEVQRKLKAKENRQNRVFLPPSSSSNIEVPSINAGVVLQPSQSVIEASSFSQFTLKELFSNEGFKDAIFKVGEETYSLIEYSIKSAFEKGRLAFDSMKQAKIFELDSKLKEEAAKKGMNLKEYGKYGNNISELMKSLEIPAKEIATKLYANSQTKEVAITEAIKSLQIEGRYLTGLDYRLKSIDSIARKLVSKSISKEDNNIQVQSLEKSSESMGDLIRYTLILDEANYTEGVKESLRKLEEMGFEIIDLKNAWNRNRTPKYQGINVGLLAKDGTIFELQFHTELSFITKETLTHEYYEIARNDSIEEENRKLADVIQTSLQENVIVPEGVETIEPFDIKIIKDINDITLEQLNKVKNPNKTTYRINNVDYSFNEVKIMVSFKDGTIFNKDTLIEDISKIDTNLFVEQLSSNEYVVKNIETGKYVSFIAGDQKGILKAINVDDAIIHCIKQEISLNTYFTEEQINNFNSTHQLVLKDVIYDSVNGQYIRIIKDRLPVVFDMSNLNKLLEKYSLEDQKMILNSLSTSQRIEYLSNIEGMKMKNEILSTLDPSYSDIEKARKIYIELAKRVTYDATFMKTQSQFIFDKNVSFENLTDNNVICKGWAELYYELLLEVGFDPNDIKIMSATSDSITHKWVTMDLHNGKTLVADAAESIIHGSDMSHAKYGGKLVGFVIVNNAQSSERLRDLLYTDIDYYQSLLAEIKLIDKKIGYIKGQTYTGEIVQKAKKLFNFSFKKDKKKAEEIAMSLFDTPIMKGSSGLDVYLYYEKLIRYNNLNMNTLDVQHGTRVDDNGHFEFYALLTSDNNRTYMVYTQSLGKVKFNDYNEYIRFLQEKGIH